MRRLSLSTKLFAAALPLIVAVGGLLVLTVRSDLDEIGRAESGAELGSVWEPLITALTAVEAEADTLDGDATANQVADPAARRATDQAINDLRTAIEQLSAFEAASAHVTSSRSALSAARRGIDMAAIAPSMAGDVDPVESYRISSHELVAIGQLLPAEAGDAQLGEQLLAVVKLAEARLHANDVIAGTEQWPSSVGDTAPLAQARVAFSNLQTTLGEFEAIAPDEWAAQFRQSGLITEIGRYGTSLASVARSADAGRVESFDTPGFAALVDSGLEFQREISQSIVERSNAQAADTRSATLVRIGIILGAVLLGLVIAWFITRSVTRRVKAVAHSANQVADEQLPALVEALRDPRGKAVLPDIAPVDARGGDDLADLATAFNSMQETLIEVAHEQVEVLRRGVSDIFITMARRNRSLIDRQLAMLDEFEAGVDDHEVLSNYYQLDHLATRMRRNSESLLVLANAEPKRRRVKATEIDDVVRASIGEVEDYRRIEIQHLESLQVKGTVVADISHLLAELLDNATSFSPPGSTVRIGGRRADDSYMIRIVDDGVGAAPERLAELNELLREPPIVGLSVDATLGMSVVSLLANKHRISVTLSAGNPGMTVDVILPSTLFGPMDAPAEISPATPAIVDPHPAGEPIVAWDDQTSGEPEAALPTIEVTPTTEPVPVAEQLRYEPAATSPESTGAPTPQTASDDEPDWTKMSLDLSAFDTPTTTPAEPIVAEPIVAEPIVAEPVEAEPVVAEPVVAEPAPASPVAETDAPTPVAGTPDLPPPPPRVGEFDVPPAPPITAGGLANRPVSPATARPAPIPAPIDASPSLPTRTQRGTGPQGPDRLAMPATATDDAVVGTSEPGALQAALAAFDSGRAAVRAEPSGALPTRDRIAGAAMHVADEQPVTKSRVDPDALRDRLRAFTTEFSSANSADTEQHRDLGGDPR